ncbi:MAG: hypothetical protein KA714_09995 [Limnoraphis sp. WC205]|jgi:hypothetical protein|nr:hypothetical protein [Limnoraphis sp. WC205]
MDSSSPFQSGQIVRLDHHPHHLYAEVIQVVKIRDVCWVRPLMLAEFSPEHHSNDLPQTLYDLRDSSDLIWPQKLFRPALDTEVIPLLVQLDSTDEKNTITSTGHQKLQVFIRQVWQAYPDVFTG